MSRYAEIQQYSPFRPVDWRWRRAKWLVARGRNFSRRRDDDETGRAVRYIRAFARCAESRLPRSFLTQYRDLNAASRIEDAGGVTEILLQARLIAGQSTEEITQSTGIPPNVVDAYEKTFFHCRDRLCARDWVSIRAIGNYDFEDAAAGAAVIFKRFAYFGGPLALEAVLPVLPDLLAGRDLFEKPLDLTTPSGQRDHGVRLAIASQMLPYGPAIDKKLLEIMLIMRDKGHRRPITRSPASISMRKPASKSKPHGFKTRIEDAGNIASTPLLDLAPDFRQSA